MKSKLLFLNPYGTSKSLVMGLLLAASWPPAHSLQAQTIWDGGGGTSDMNDSTNWTTDTLPTTSATWDGTAPGVLSLLWTSNLGDGTSGMSLNVNAGQTNKLTLDAANGTALLSISTITVASGAGAFSIGNGDGTAAALVLRGTNNTFVNNGSGTVVFQSDVLFNSGGGANRTITFSGPGSWTFNSGLYAHGTGNLSINVNGSNTTTVTLTKASTKAANNNSINFGTLRLTDGDALGISGSATLSIANGGGVKRLALSNNISLNAAVASIVINAANIAPDNNTTSASILNEGGNNSIAGNIAVSFGGTNVNIHSQAGMLTLNGGLSTAAGVTTARNVNFAGAGNITVNGAVTDGRGQVGVSKMGAGTLTLAASNTFTGATTISNGTLQLNSSSGRSLGSTASVSIMSTNATLLLSKSNQINNTNTVVTLSGGTIKRESGVSETFGNLSVTAASTLDFGNGTAGTLTFGTYTPSSLLAVNNFFYGNKLIFKSELSSSINNTNLFAFSSDFTTDWDGSLFTITAIPEPSALIAAASLVGLLLWPSRRHLHKR